ncbi:MAG: SprT-like domain-containing protein [Ignavibacteria bacterium]
MDRIDEYKFSLKITRSRMSKLGDYRHPFNGKPHQITVNHNLNKFSFLITLIHEVAHLTVWNKYGRKAQPHGKEWKEEFKLHIRPFIELEIFPPDILACLNTYSINPKAASCSDTELVKVLKKYDELSDYVHLENISEYSTFRLMNGRTFIKGKRIRTRYMCTDISSKKKYLISPVAEVMQISMF